ncbi:MAG TPA: DNA-3-methyladenine glycosylase [Vicinamibacterales bacterium]|nr:DNA-3-methyladenine glycosylase [Vicinamibacterales bacterium]
MRRDPVLGAAIKRIGACGMAGRQHTHHFTALVRAIVSQQLSTKAAATIYARLAALFPDGEVTRPEIVAQLDDATLRGVGLSGQKVAYLRDLSSRIADGRLDLDTLESLSDADVIERLTAVKGFGRWTAEMFLMFRLHRPDVLPVGDLGIVNAVQKMYRLRTRPKPDKLTKIGEAWRPYRSVACWYLWQTIHIAADEARRKKLAAGDRKNGLKGKRPVKQVKKSKRRSTGKVTRGRA